MEDKVTIYQVIDGKLREGGPVDRAAYEAVWKERGWRLSPPKKKEKEETE